MLLRAPRAVSLLLVAILAGVFATASPVHASSALDATLARIAGAGGATPVYRAAIARTLGSGAHVRTDRLAWDGPAREARSCQDDICTASFFDGAHAYAIDANGSAAPEGRFADAYLRTLVAIETHAFALPAFRERGGQVEEITPADAPLGMHRFRVRAPDGAALLAETDPSTDRIAKISRLNGTESLELSGYADVSGTQVATIRRESVNAEYEPIAGVPLARPHGLLSIGTADPPARFTASGTRPYFGCVVGSLPARCLLDTGAGGLDLSLAFAERLGLEPAGAITIAGVGSYVTGYVRAQSLELPGVRFGPALYAVVHDLDAHGCDVVVGADILASTIVTVDYAARTIAFAPSGAEPAVPLGLPIAFHGRIPYAAARIGGTNAELAIDTGDDAVLDLSGAFFARTHPFLARESSRRQGTGGSSTAFEGYLESLDVGAIHRERVPAIVTDRLRGDGHLGSGFFAGRSLVLDYAHERIGVSPLSLPEKR